MPLIRGMSIKAKNVHCLSCQGCRTEWSTLKPFKDHTHLVVVFVSFEACQDRVSVYWLPRKGESPVLSPDTPRNVVHPPAAPRDGVLFVLTMTIKRDLYCVDRLNVVVMTIRRGLYCVKIGSMYRLWWWGKACIVLNRFNMLVIINRWGLRCVKPV